MPLEKLLSPISIGNLELPNRVVMAPLTRNRASQPGDVPSEMNARYYAQRAGAGLIVSEATHISRQGQGYWAAPGIYSDAQEAGWKNVAGAVHARQGRIALQLWHVGRVSHRLAQADGAQPVAPSAIRAEDSQVFVKNEDGTLGFVDVDEPRALETSELPGIVLQYVDATQRAKRAGFDMVEVHAANGYLLQQFMSTNTNRRTDEYGGSVENRVRLTVEVLEAVAGVIGADRVGIRISPNFVGFDLKDAEAEESAIYLVKELKRIGDRVPAHRGARLGGRRAAIGEFPPNAARRLRRRDHRVRGIYGGGSGGAHRKRRSGRRGIRSRVFGEPGSRRAVPARCAAQRARRGYVLRRRRRRLHRLSGAR